MADLRPLTSDASDLSHATWLVTCVAETVEEFGGGRGDLWLEDDLSPLVRTVAERTTFKVFTNFLVDIPVAC